MGIRGGMGTPRLPGKQKIESGAKPQFTRFELLTLSKSCRQIVGQQIVVARFSDGIDRAEVVILIVSGLQPTLDKLGPRIGDGFDG